MLAALLSLTACSNALAAAPMPEPCKDTVLVTVRATGIGHPPPRMKGAQAKLMARRAAEVVAVRNLAKKLGIESGERVSGFRYVVTKDLPNGKVEVTVEKTIEVPRRSVQPPKTPSGP